MRRLFFLCLILSLVFQPVLPALALKATDIDSVPILLSTPTSESVTIDKNSAKNPSLEPAAPSLELAPNQVITSSTTEEPEAASAPLSPPIYSMVMRRLEAIRTGNNIHLPADEQATPPDALRARAVTDLEYMLTAEKDRLQALNVPRSEYKPYLKLLKNQLEAIDPREPGWWEKLGQWFFDLFDIESPPVLTLDQVEPELRLPPYPGSFGFSDSAAVKVLPIRDVTVTVAPDQNPANFLSKLKNWKDRINLQLTESVSALDDPFLPTLADVRSDLAMNQATDPNTTDSGEVVISSEITDLATALDHNPVKIFNFVRNTIVFEPYYGAKKGSEGCLRERICNDTDTASLTIALLRAAGIPARYKKALTIMSVDQLKTMLGVDETRTAFLALAFGRYPVFVLDNSASPSSPNVLSSPDLDQYDFSGETHLALEWTHPEAFVRYDEQGANYTNTLSFATAVSTEAVRVALRSGSPSNSTYTKQQWLPFEVLVKSYQKNNRPVLVDVAGGNWDPAGFFNNYLSVYTGILTPTEKYRQDLLSVTGQDIENNLSGKTIIPKNFSILPPTRPYLIGSGTAGSGGMIGIETFSQLPADRRHQVTLSLRREQNSATDIVLTRTFFGADISNQPLNLFYRGATPTDEQIIESYGGLQQTPATLVSLVPVFQLPESGVEITTNNTLRLGDALILRFEHALPILATQSWWSSPPPPQPPLPTLEINDKFSTAGNYEGIYLTLSRVQPDSTLDTDQKILLSGPAALARAYLTRLQTSADLLKHSLDYESHSSFSRAVVTQNRILNRINGLPTTFDFKGLTIDAAVRINDYSNTSHYTTHRETFRRVWGLEASNQEARVFEDIAGIESIATVKGLQHAYRNPASYTVYNISSSTLNYETLINSLNLSPNTKQNLIADIRDRNHTVTTPGQPVTLGTFTGQLYLSLSPEWTGNFAIGEQTAAKGGWSTSPVANYTYQDESGRAITYQRATGSQNQTFLYQDKLDFGAVNCKVDNTWRQQMEARPDWLLVFGFPCAEGAVRFGEVEHRYIVAANAIKFFRANNYDYWAHHEAIKNQMEAYINALPRVDTRYDYRFSMALGTYLRPICVNTTLGKCIGDNNDADVYYSPYQNGSDIGRVYRLTGNFLDKAAKDNNRIIKIIGSPTSDTQTAASSPYGTTGSYQNFVNGQMFFYEKWNEWDSIQYTYGKLTEEHNNQGGTGSTMGFPHTDPIERNGFVFQEFEGQNELKWNLGTNVTTLEVFKKYRCELDRHWDNPAYQGFVVGHGVWDTGVQTADDLGSLLGAVLSGLLHPSQTYAAARDLAEQAKQIDGKQIRDFLAQTGNAIHGALIHEYDTSLGPNGCAQRSAYLTGRLAGEVLLIYVPLSKLKAIEKVQVIKHAQRTKLGVKIAGGIGKWAEYISDVLKYIDRIPSSIKARFSPIRRGAGLKHILLGDFDENGRFISGLHSPRTLKNGMDNVALEVWSVDRTLKYTKFADIPVQENGVRRVTILNNRGQKFFKSIFPDEWTDEDIVDALLEAADAGGLANVTKHGKTVEVFSYIPSNLIESGYPN